MASTAPTAPHADRLHRRDAALHESRAGARQPRRGRARRRLRHGGGAVPDADRRAAVRGRRLAGDREPAPPRARAGRLRCRATGCRRGSRPSSSRCLAKHPDDRYPSARAVLDALRDGRAATAGDAAPSLRGRDPHGRHARGFAAGVAVGARCVAVGLVAARRGSPVRPLVRARRPGRPRSSSYNRLTEPIALTLEDTGFTGRARRQPAAARRGGPAARGALGHGASDLRTTAGLLGTEVEGSVVSDAARGELREIVGRASADTPGSRRWWSIGRRRPLDVSVVGDRRQHRLRLRASRRATRCGSATIRSRPRQRRAGARRDRSATAPLRRTATGVDAVTGAVVRPGHARLAGPVRRLRPASSIGGQRDEPRTRSARSSPVHAGRLPTAARPADARTSARQDRGAVRGNRAAPRPGCRGGRGSDLLLRPMLAFTNGLAAPVQLVVGDEPPQTVPPGGAVRLAVPRGRTLVARVGAGAAALGRRARRWARTCAARPWCASPRGTVRRARVEPHAGRPTTSRRSSPTRSTRPLRVHGERGAAGRGGLRLRGAAGRAAGVRRILPALSRTAPCGARAGRGDGDVPGSGPPGDGRRRHGGASIRGQGSAVTERLRLAAALANALPGVTAANPYFSLSWSTATDRSRSRRRGRRLEQIGFRRASERFVAAMPMSRTPRLRRRTSSNAARKRSRAAS